MYIYRERERDISHGNITKQNLTTWQDMTFRRFRHPAAYESVHVHTDDVGKGLVIKHCYWWALLSFDHISHIIRPCHHIRTKLDRYLVCSDTCKFHDTEIPCWGVPIGRGTEVVQAGRRTTCLHRCDYPRPTRILLCTIFGLPRPLQTTFELKSF